MSRSRTGRVRRLFQEALERVGDERDAYLEKACAGDRELRQEVASLLAAHEQSDGFLESPALDRPREDEVQAADPLIGSTLGRYRILELLGRGGMGVIYRAEQDRPRREVALKLIGRDAVSAGLLRRFEIETEVLGRLQHPGIAQILEAGIADSDSGRQPFFAMELIHGQPLTDYADRCRLNRTQRIELMIRICDAVQHAHQKGVIHRDLKPANILVDESGQPKVLDFGVARVTDTDIQFTTVETNLGTLLGTLPYMSPEQVGGRPEQLDTRSDVYSLGVLCYELLTGQRPRELHDVTLPEAIRIVSGTEPRRLSESGSSFPADIETVVAKALALERSRRYASASELAADLRRFLEDAPIAARPTSVAYQFRKLVVRHKLPFALTAVLALLLVVFAVSTAIQANRLSAERELVAQEAETAKQVSKFLENLFRVSNPSEARGNSVTAREILDEGAAKIEFELDGQPRIQARLMTVLGAVYRNLGLLDSAEPLLERALEVHRVSPGNELQELYESATALIWLRRAQGRYDDALALARELVSVTEEGLPAEHRSIAGSLTSLGALLRDTGDLDGARSALERALAMCERALGPDHFDVAVTLQHLGWLQRLAGDLERAQQLYERALPILEGNDRLDFLAACLNDLSVVASERGDGEQAREYLERALSIRERIFSPDHPAVAETLDNLGTLLLRLGDYDDARRQYDRSLRIRQRTLGPEHPAVASSLNNLALVEQRLGRLDDYERLLRSAMEIWTRQHPDSPRQLNTMQNLAHYYYYVGRFSEAAPLFEQVVDLRESLLGPDDAALTTDLFNLGRCYTAIGRQADAERLFRRVLARRDAAPGAEHEQVAVALRWLARSLVLQERYDDADTSYVQALELLEASGAEDSRELAEVVWGLGDVRIGRGDASEADRLYRRSLAIRERAEPDHPFLPVAQACYWAFKQDREKALEALRRALAGGHPSGRILANPYLAFLRDDPELRTMIEVR